MFICVSCFGLVESTYQVIGWKDSSDDTFMWRGAYRHKAQMEEIVCIFSWFGLFMLLCVPPALHNICHTPMARYSLFVLKVLLNTNKSNQTLPTL